MASCDMAPSLRAKVAAEIEGFLGGHKDRAALGAVSFRNVKEHLQTSLGEEAFKELLVNHKDHLKAEATRLVQEMQERAEEAEEEVEREKEKRKEAKKRSRGGDSDSDDFVEDKGKGKKRVTRPVREEGSSDSEDDFVEKASKRGKVAGKTVLKVQKSEDSGSESDDFVDKKRAKKKVKKGEDENSAPNSKAKGKGWEDKGGKGSKSKGGGGEGEAKKSVSAEVARLKELAMKKCKLTVPVNCYRGSPDSDELERRIGKWLLSVGLPSLHPKREEIAKFRAAKALEAELEGIDRSNIVKGRRTSKEEDEGQPKEGLPKYRLKPVDSDED